MFPVNHKRCLRQKLPEGWEGGREERASTLRVLFNVVECKSFVRAIGYRLFPRATRKFTGRPGFSRKPACFYKFSLGLSFLGMQLLCFPKLIKYKTINTTNARCININLYLPLPEWNGGRGFSKLLFIDRLNATRRLTVKRAKIRTITKQLFNEKAGTLDGVRSRKFKTEWKN